MLMLAGIIKITNATYDGKYSHVFDVERGQMIMIRSQKCQIINLPPY